MYKLFRIKWQVSVHHFTEVRFDSFLSGGFATMAVINPLDWKLANRTSVKRCYSCSIWWLDFRWMAFFSDLLYFLKAIQISQWHNQRTYLGTTQPSAYLVGVICPPPPDWDRVNVYLKMLGKRQNFENCKVKNQSKSECVKCET